MNREEVAAMYFMPKFREKEPVETNCTNCNNRVTTTTDQVMGMQQKIWAKVCCFTMICIPLAWCPLVMKNWNDVIHYCPICKFAVGRYSGLDYCM